MWEEIFNIHCFHNIYRFADLLEDTFSVTFAIQIAIVTVAMSISLLQVRAYLIRIL